MTTTLDLGTVIDVPEGQALFLAQTTFGPKFVIAASAPLATATLLREEIGVYSVRKVA